MKFSGKCPVCGEQLRLARLTCPGCKAEFPTDEPLSLYEQLTEEQARFLRAFLVCSGSLKDVQKRLGISYPTARKRLNDLLLALGLSDECGMDEREETENEEVTMGIFKNTNPNSTKASDIIREKLCENGGRATVYSVTGKPYIIRAANDGRTFLCNELPASQTFTYNVFDVIVELLLGQDGAARKGNGRNYALGEGDCTLDTVVGAIGKNYFGATEGKYVFDPVFVLASVLDWAGIAHNERGYLRLTAEYLAKVQR